MFVFFLKKIKINIQKPEALWGEGGNEEEREQARAAMPVETCSHSVFDDWLKRSVYSHASPFYCALYR